MTLKVYADRLSQPSRAVLIFCKVNGINFEEVTIDLLKGQQRSPQFKEINPMGQVPAIVNGRLKLFESHAILRYFACAFPGVSDHWYPADLSNRAKIDAILDWHHLNLRRSLTFVLNTELNHAFGLPLNPQAASEDERVVSSSLSKIESLWLKENAKFLLGNSLPSIADLSLVREIMQMQVLAEKDSRRVLGPHDKIGEWVENVKSFTSPHFQEVHEYLYKVKEKLPSSSAGLNSNV